LQVQECTPCPDLTVDDGRERALAYVASLRPPPLGSPGTLMDPEVVEHSICLAARVGCEEDLAHPLLRAFLSTHEGPDAGACASW
jgi:hypothetical protein